MLTACPQDPWAEERRRFPVGVNPTRQPLQPEATGAAMEVTKWLKPSLRQEKSRRGGRKCNLKPFIAIQRVRLPPGKGEPASRKRALHG
jgi:hypothetical protein